MESAAAGQTGRNDGFVFSPGVCVCLVCVCGTCFCFLFRAVSGKTTYIL